MWNHAVAEVDGQILRCTRTPRRTKCYFTDLEVGGAHVFLVTLQNVTSNALRLCSDRSIRACVPQHNNIRAAMPGYPFSSLVCLM